MALDLQTMLAMYIYRYVMKTGAKQTGSFTLNGHQH